jgi:hypothetical protein
MKGARRLRHRSAPQLQAWPRRDRAKAEGRALSIGPVQSLAEGQESGGAGDAEAVECDVTPAASSTGTLLASVILRCSITISVPSAATTASTVASDRSRAVLMQRQDDEALQTAILSIVSIVGTAEIVRRFSHGAGETRPPCAVTTAS